MDEEQLKQITDETYHFLNNKGVSFICYIWDKEGKLGGGCQSADADIGNALVAINGIVKHFDIDPDRLFIALQKAEFEMDTN